MLVLLIHALSLLSDNSDAIQLEGSRADPKVPSLVALQLAFILRNAQVHNSAHWKTVLTYELSGSTRL